MALIMMTIGGLLALLGVYAMATGFPVIEIERGWSMVISGAVLLSGGLIVASLGIVVRTLAGLKSGLSAASPAPHLEPEIAPAAIPVMPPAPPVEAASVPAYAVAAPVAAAALATGAGYAAMQRQLEPLDEAPHEPVPEPTSEDRAVLDHPVPEPVEQLDEAPTSSEAKPGDLLGHDWLDREFAAFDLNGPQHAPPPHEPEPHAPWPTAHEDSSPPAAHEPPPAEVTPAEVPPAEVPPEPVAAHADEPVAALVSEPVADAPSTAPETPPADLAVIGRYDSDGTSYVMYSDGSIEAQSESGVFRFSSMAELKAFIEG